jgi:hypothetical protein
MFEVWELISDIDWLQVGKQDISVLESILIQKTRIKIKYTSMSERQNLTLWKFVHDGGESHEEDLKGVPFATHDELVAFVTSKTEIYRNEKKRYEQALSDLEQKLSSI